MNKSAGTSIRVAAGSLNQLPMDWGGNYQNLVEALKQAVKEGVDVVCFPELCIPGYGCEDMFLSEFVLRSSLDRLITLIPQTSKITCAVGLPIKIADKLYNSIAVISDGKLLGFSCKHNLAKGGVYYEPRWFTPWEPGRSTSISINGSDYPIGDIIFNISGIRIGFEICEDAWASDRVAASLREVGVDLILNPSASHFAFGKEQIRVKLAEEGSKLCQCVYVYCNHLGNDAGRLIYDGSRIITQNGRLIAHGRRFTFRNFELTSVDVTLIPKEVNAAKTDEVKANAAWHYNRPAITGSLVADCLSKEEELYQSVSLGLFDYMRKSQSKGFVVSLSGGGDSAVVATLAVSSLKEAERGLGLVGLKKKLEYWAEIQKAASIDEIIRVAVLCVYQSTLNSGEETRLAARAVSAELGCGFLELSLSGLVDGYLDLLKQNAVIVSDLGLPIDLTWQKHDIALQNIQARTRGPGIWLLANLKGALLLSTSNRSEASVGYTTMDGDTCGGLSPIAGVDKAYLRKWLIWLERTGPKGSSPIRSIKLVNAQEPTAELRPIGSKQTDEMELMPYEILDRIERLAVRDKISPQEILNKLNQEFDHHSRSQLLEWVRKFHRLWAQNQWKRERFAPSFHLDDQSVDPKTWCRFPILSSGYDEELKLLS